MPVVSVAAPVASPESTLRAAASASMVSFLARRERRCGCGWLTSITPTALIDQRPGQSRTERPGGLDTDRCNRAERREPRMGQAVAGTGRRERLCAQYSPERVERRGDTEVGVALNPADHRLLWIWHAVVGHLGAAVPGRDGQNSDEASVGTGSYEVTSLVPDRPAAGKSEKQAGDIDASQATHPQRAGPVL